MIIRKASIILAIITISLSLTACKRAVIYEDYPVPVYVVPKPPNIQRPSLPIHQLNNNDSTDINKVILAYVTSIRLLLNYSEAHEKILGVYDKLSDRNMGGGGLTFSSSGEGAVEDIGEQDVNDWYEEIGTIINNYEMINEDILNEFENDIRSK